jgi:two-component system CheB/CheR fusion protein
VHPQGSGKLLTWQHEAAIRMAGLTTRERQIMAMVLAGHASKHIAGTLGISPRTVENHRASIMQKTNAKSLPELVRLALAAASGRGEADSNHAASDPAPPP